MPAITLRPDDGATSYLVDEICQRLTLGQSVLWLVPGGSASVIALEAFRRIEANDTSRLFITLTDERYGPLGHPNENWTQLQNAGFNPAQATMYRVLTGDDVSTTVQKFEERLETWLPEVDFSIGLFGIGPDGHTAGIKPESPASTSTEAVAYFKGEDFERITVTPNIIKQLDEAVAYACGKAKFPTLQRLMEEEVPIPEQPAQALKLAGKTTLFSDYQST